MVAVFGRDSELGSFVWQQPLSNTTFHLFSLLHLSDSLNISCRSAVCMNWTNNCLYLPDGVFTLKRVFHSSCGNRQWLYCYRQFVMVTYPDLLHLMLKISIRSSSSKPSN